MLLLGVEVLLSLNDALQINDRMHAAIEEARKRFGLARILADARAALVQPADVTAALASPSTYLYGKAERYAIVVSSSLLKFQVNRVIDDSRARAFFRLNQPNHGFGNSPVERFTDCALSQDSH